MNVRAGLDESRRHANRLAVFTNGLTRSDRDDSHFVASRNGDAGDERAGAGNVDGITCHSRFEQDGDGVVRMQPDRSLHEIFKRRKSKVDANVRDVWFLGIERLPIFCKSVDTSSLKDCTNVPRRA